MTRCLSLAASAVMCATCLAGEQTLRTIDWPQPYDGPQLGVEVLPADKAKARPFAELKIVNESGKPQTVPVLKLEDPPITAERYTLAGSVRYENVQGPAYLEMWSYFPDGAFYFSRTVMESGPMQKMEGSSNWRAFELPFVSGKDSPPPTRLLVNVVMPGNGTVHLGRLKLTQPAPATGQVAAALRAAPEPNKAWWTPAQATIGGTVAGCACGILGAMVGLLALFRRAGGAVVGILYAMICAGAALLVVGLVALAASQPYHVHYPPLLTGGLAALIAAGVLPAIRRQYREQELRRMQALDAA